MSMRGDLIYNLYGRHRGRDEDVYFGAFRSLAEAQAEIVALEARETHGSNWARAYHDLGFEVRTSVVDTDFEFPSRPKPRDLFGVRVTPINAPGGWRQVDVEVFRRTDASLPGETVARYARNYAMCSTFEPFRQGSRDYALISREYTATAVLDLATGEVVAEEPVQGNGFCPVGFYVPDWWDVHGGSHLPGSRHWTSHDEWPDGTFGFVWGCFWGDDTSWKVQLLDLRDVSTGVIRRHERFGYLELAVKEWDNPCFSTEPPLSGGSRPPPFIRVLPRTDAGSSVQFDVEMRFAIEDGTNNDWRRERVSNLE
jgi:hypothetical protein